MKREIQELKESIAFFQRNAGWASPPGRMACAVKLARAERDAELAGFKVEWSEDDDREKCCDCCARDKQCDDAEVLFAVLTDQSGKSLTSLSGICGSPVSEEYKRLVAAELASEAFERR